LFASETKFESGTGWPSFYQALPNSIVEKSDRTFMMVRTETLCRRCGGHLGHVFDDGPKPTGLRLHERAGADVPSRRTDQQPDARQFLPARQLCPGPLIGVILLMH
jgi:hypothetical protein